MKRTQNEKILQIFFIGGTEQCDTREIRAV